MRYEIVRKALPLWGLEDAEVTLAAERENSVYRIEYDGDTFALRLHRVGYRSEEELKAELDWMAELARNGLPVPEPLRPKEGEFCHTIDGVTVDVLSWLRGETMGKKSRLAALPDPFAAYRNLGMSMARLHRVSDNWDLPAGFSRPAWSREGLLGENPLWGKFWENPTLSDAQVEKYVRFRKFAGEVLRQEEQNQDYGLIHADLVPENVLVDGSDIQLIDFDDGGFGFRLFDIATTLNWANRTDNFLEYRQFFLEGYCAERQIDLTLLPLFQAMRSLTYVGWIVPRFDEPEAEQRNARYLREADFWIDKYYASN